MNKKPTSHFSKLIFIGWALFILSLLLPLEPAGGERYYGYEFSLFTLDQLLAAFTPAGWSELTNSGLWPFIELYALSNIFSALVIFFIYIKSKRVLIVLSVVFLYFFMADCLYLLRNESIEMGLSHVARFLSSFIIAMNLIVHVVKFSSLGNGK